MTEDKLERTGRTTKSLKVGLKEDFRGIEYELECTFEVDLDHIARPEKDNTTYLKLYMTVSIYSAMVKKSRQWCEEGY